MSDIKRLIIDNFQSHEHTVIEFGKGLNVITGPSDQGKSAILRAIKWVLYNEPRGMEYIRQGAAAARVALEMSNGYTIIRERSKSRNKYSVLSPEGNEQSFEGFGNEVPEEIIKAHGIPKVVLDKDLKSSLNFADQLESPFLLSETGAVRAKAIGRLTGVHIIDNAIRECMVDIRRESQTEDRIRKELDDISSKIKSYEYLDDMKERLEESEKIIDKLNLLIERKSLTENIRERYNDAKIELDKIRHILGKLDNLSRCESIIAKCTESFLKLSSIRKFEQGLRSVDDGIRESEGLLQNTFYLDKVKELIAAAGNKNSIKNSLEGLLKIKENLDSEFERCLTVLDASKAAKDIENCTKLLESKIQRIKRLKEIKEKCRNNSRDIQQAGEYLSKVENISRVEQFISKAGKDAANLVKLSEIKRDYDSITNYISDGEKFLDNNRQQIDQLLKKYLEHLKMLGRCPMCGSTISDSEIKDIIKHYEEVQ